MFIAKFQVANNAPFTADKNGNWPLIGTVLAGIAFSTLINGTMAQRDNISTEGMYLCKNTQVEIVNKATGEVSKVWNTEVISKVSTLELLQSEALLGPAKLVSSKVAVETPAETVAEPALV